MQMSSWTELEQEAHFSAGLKAEEVWNCFFCLHAVKIAFPSARCEWHVRPKEFHHAHLAPSRCPVLLRLLWRSSLALMAGRWLAAGAGRKHHGVLKMHKFGRKAFPCLQVVFCCSLLGPWARAICWLHFVWVLMVLVGTRASTLPAA